MIKAWDILTEDEKLAITLSINHKKSTWEAGEIMGKAHYKYLEIQARAKTFFMMFTEYLKKTNNLLIPEGVYLDKDVIEFIRLTIIERMGYRSAIKNMGNTALMISSARERIIEECMEQLLMDENPLAIDLYDLILDFDRWNNFRILPISIQEPSAFKRRNKTRLIKHLKNMKNLHDFHIDRFIMKFKYKRGDLKYAYLPLISDMFKNGYKVVKIKNRKHIIHYISKQFTLYVFKDEDDADDYGYLVEGYLNNLNKNCKHGQIFWPKFRKIITKASNYNEVNNIIPRRKNLENAFRDIDNITIKRMRKNISEYSDPAKRVTKNKIWDI